MTLYRARIGGQKIGTLTFIEHAERCGCQITHLFEFTDNCAAKLTLDFGKPKTPETQELTQPAYVELFNLKIFNSMQRVASVDNDIADGLSREGGLWLTRCV